MFSSKKQKRKSETRIDSLIGQNTELHGDVVFNGGFHVDGKMKGNIRADDSSSLLTLSDHGVVEGEVRVPNIVLNGTVIGDVYASERIELASNAKVVGNVYYNLIEMVMGAEVNGNLVHQATEVSSSATAPKDVPSAPKAKPDKPAAPVDLAAAPKASSQT